MTCNCDRKNYLGPHPVPRKHLLVLNFETGQVNLYAAWGRIPHPAEYLARYYDRSYGSEGSPNDPVPA